jgi:hypothetical protein
MARTHETGHPVCITIHTQQKSFLFTIKVFLAVYYPLSQIPELTHLTKELNVDVGTYQL